MRVRRLGWAGIEIEAAGERAVIDAVTAMPRPVDPVGPLRTAFAPPAGGVSLAMVTHMHENHAEAVTLAAALAPHAVLLRPTPAQGGPGEILDAAVAEAALTEQAVPTRTVEPWQTVDAGPFRATAVPAANGLGAPQVSWVVTADGRRILHCGDTLFHGHWWQIARRLGPFDAVFLPVNGAVCDFPHPHPANPYPIALDPRQAAAAAYLSGARIAVPMHYDSFHTAGAHEPADDSLEAFTAACDKLGVTSHVLEPDSALVL
jgi:L-ascorbate metabolism protein UlaG (beta-lactamase superfamily)